MINPTEDIRQGAFLESLKRNNRQIKDDRAAAIVEDAEIGYRRKVEDLERSLKQMLRDQNNMLDLSPENVTTLKVASDFNSEDFISRDHKLGVDIRNQKIKLEVAKERYLHLFGTGENNFTASPLPIGSEETNNQQ